MPCRCLIARALIAPCFAILVGSLPLPAEEPAQATPEKRSIQIEFLMLDATPGTMPAAANGEQIMELVKQQKFSELTRLKLSARHDQATEVQFGEQAPVEVSRMQSPRGGDIGNFQYQNHGLTVNVTPSIQADNSLTLEFSFSRSRLAPVKPAPTTPEASTKSFTPPKMELFQTKTKLRVESGRPLVVAQREISAKDGSVTLLVLVATISP